MFIAFEGIDACGKSTQIQLFAEYIKKRGFKYTTVREPGGTKLGEKIREILINEDMNSRSELLLFLASRAQLVEEVIKPALKRGEIVIADRFADSSVAYQGGARGLGVEIVQRLNDFATDNVYPNLIFFIDIPVEIAIQRLEKNQKDRIEKEGAKFFEIVRETYLKLAKNNKNFVIIDGNDDINEIHRRIVEHFELRTKSLNH
ncbi:MAG: dTMP kinase [Fervidobacterium sp.]|uniref:Thymidylate kinase n=1 Tax=Fervidobacterium gondwanense DSM 13020 TaxID=1121883 RepID=A0A1M7T561_FERGO|nr:dTMP kinase [Fervidobacterium gondwanense]UXF00731.1 thymidylate kinase [Fervidobacterium riparium]SHN65825.1 thymidylate kinase [Fervidobacterium gondwanense DSM 13020]